MPHFDNDFQNHFTALPRPAASGTPRAELQIDAATARRLVLAQHPDLADLPIAEANSGWDNVMFRLGDELALRLPRRAIAAQLLLNEQRWLPLLRDRLPLSVPSALRVGKPQDGYPWPWSITRWIDGEAADVSPPADDQGGVLAGFLRALHEPAPESAPHNPFRGVALAERAKTFDDGVEKLDSKTGLIDDRLRALWRDALAADNDAAPTWIHGDLHPRNVLVLKGRFRGVIDWGDMARGDRATDLAAVWMLLPQLESRKQAMAECGRVSDDAWRRARGWALLFSVVLLNAGLVDDARMVAIAELTIKRLLDGP